MDPAQVWARMQGDLPGDAVKARPAEGWRRIAGHALLAAAVATGIGMVLTVVGVALTFGASGAGDGNLTILLAAMALALAPGTWIVVELILAGRVLLGLGRRDHGWLLLALAVTFTLAPVAAFGSEAVDGGIDRALAGGSALGPLLGLAGGGVAVASAIVWLRRAPSTSAPAPIPGAVEAPAPAARAAHMAPTLALVGAGALALAEAVGLDPAARASAWEQAIGACAMPMAAWAWLEHDRRRPVHARRLALAALLLFGTVGLASAARETLQTILTVLGAFAPFLALSGTEAVLAMLAVAVAFVPPVAALVVASHVAAQRRQSDLARSELLPRRLTALATLGAAVGGAALMAGMAGSGPWSGLDGAQLMLDLEPVGLALLGLGSLALAGACTLVAGGVLAGARRNHPAFQAAALGIALTAALVLAVLVVMAAPRSHGLALQGVGVGPREDPGFASAAYAVLQAGPLALVWFALMPAAVTLLVRSRAAEAPVASGVAEDAPAQTTAQTRGVVVVPRGRDAAGAEGLPSTQDWDFAPGKAV